MQVSCFIWCNFKIK